MGRLGPIFEVLRQARLVKNFIFIGALIRRFSKPSELCAITIHHNLINSDFVNDLKRSVAGPRVLVMAFTPVCKQLRTLNLSEHHKILGLFLDRPQEVAVMSLSQR